MADTPMTGPDAPRPGLTRRQAYEARIRKRSLVVAASSTAAVILALIIVIPAILRTGGAPRRDGAAVVGDHGRAGILRRAPDLRRAVSPRV